VGTLTLMLVLENVIRDSVTYTEHAKRKTGKSILLDLTLQPSIRSHLILSI
jgi:histone H3/H4